MRMTATCGACSQSITQTSSCTACSECTSRFHSKCVSTGTKIDAEAVENIQKWKCSKCSSPKKPLANINRPTAAANVTVQHKSATKKPVRGKTSVHDVYSMFVELKKDLNVFQSGLVDSIKKLYDQIEANSRSFEEHANKLAQCFDTIDGLKKENEELKRNIETIKKKQTETDQKTRLNDLEIRGVPYQPNENVMGILRILAIALRSPLLIDEHCVVFCYRGRSREEGLPGTIFVRFSHHAYKDDLLRRRCSLRGFSSRQMVGLPVASDDPVFVNESLCPERRVLFKKVSEIRKLKKYRYVWTREGRILTRRTDTSEVIAINCLADLDKL